MQKPTDPDDYELRDEYDLATMTVVAKGRYAPDRRAGKNVALLAEDVVESFPTSEQATPGFSSSPLAPGPPNGV